MLVLAILGFADTAYLTIESLRGAIPPCTTDGCEQVLTSVYAHIGPIPLSLIGALYYLAVIVLIILSLDTRSGRYVRWGAWLVSAGFIVSLILVLLQAFVLNAYCQYCLVSAGITTLLALCGIFVVRQTTEAQLIS